MLTSGIRDTLNYDFCLPIYFNLKLDLGYRFVILIWDIDLGYRFGILIWDIDLGYRFGITIWDIVLEHRFGISIWDIGLGHRFGISIWDIDLGYRFGILIWDIKRKQEIYESIISLYLSNLVFNLIIHTLNLYLQLTIRNIFH